MKRRPITISCIKKSPPPFRSAILPASDQDRFGLHSVPLFTPRVILAPRMDGIPGHCLPALGEAFMTFFFAAYFFSSHQEDAEGALTT
ncbi:hypothetical protein BGX26_004455, partial [Mortierella sp. AD094]